MSFTDDMCFYEDDDDDEDLYLGPISIRCKFCGETGFGWGVTAAGYRLFKDGIQHNCISGTEVSDMSDRAILRNLIANRKQP